MGKYAIRQAIALQRADTLSGGQQQRVAIARAYRPWKISLRR